MKIVPKPKEIIFFQGVFENVLIKNVLLNNFDDDRIFKELKKINACIVKTESEDADLVFKQDDLLHEQGYNLEINKNQIIISAKTLVGAFYGIKTLMQIFKDEEVKCLKIEDSPDLEIRGVMLDISRSKVPTLATLKNLVDIFAMLKYNHLELYVEGFSYEYKSFKDEISIDNNYLPFEDYMILQEYCENNFIDLVPNQNGCGHMAAWLELPKYKELAECEDGFFIWGAHRPTSTLDVTNPKSAELVKKMYDDMLPYFNSKYFNMNFDEPFEIGYGKSKEMVEQYGEAAVFIKYFKELSYYVKTKYKKIPMLWGDVLLKHPDAISDLPKDVVFIDWGYNHRYDFESHAKLLFEKQVDFMVAPGTVTWGNILGNALDMEGSIKHSSEAAKKYNAKGLLLTDWGDIGHLQYLPICYPGFVYAAIKSWSDGDETDILNGVNLILDNLTLSELIIKLSKFIPLEGPYRDYGCRLFCTILWAEHASRYENRKEFFLEKMKHNLIDEDNVSSLREFFDDALKTLENIENSIEKEELKNSIFLLQILLDINVKLTSIYNNQNTNEIDFEKEISLLEIYSKSHLNLWDTRNIHEGYKMSNQRILWLKEVLALAKTERS